MTKQLRRPERHRYVRMLFRQLPGAVWMTDRDLCLTYVAGRLSNDMGPRAKPGMYVYDVVGTRDPTNTVIASHRAAIAGEPQSFEYQLGDRWYAVSVEQLKGETGEVAGSIAAASDITEQRATQQRLVRSEELLAQAQRVAHIGSFEWNIASNAVTWSDELQRIYGLEPGQFNGTFEAFLERVHPDDLERTQSTYSRLASKKVATCLRTQNRSSRRQSRHIAHARQRHYRRDRHTDPHRGLLLGRDGTSTRNGRTRAGALDAGSRNRSDCRWTSCCRSQRTDNHVQPSFSFVVENSVRSCPPAE